MILVNVLCVVFVYNGVTGSVASCVHGGTKYKDGEYFPSNSTVIQVEDPQQCVQCRCRQGLVVCEIENCPVLNCETPIRHPRFCCTQCPETLKIYEEPSDFIISETNVGGFPKKSKSDCISNGRHLANGSIWQPVIGPFGAMACIQCRCHDGSIVCSRLKCRELPCSHPRQEIGECCPVCPITDKSKKLGASCLPKTSELFVFKTPNVQNNTQKIQYAFVEAASREETVIVHTWNVSPKRLGDVHALEIVTWHEFRKMNLKVFGSVSQKRFKKYSKRESKLGANCSANCLRKIERLENSLRVFTPFSRSKCNEDEIDVVDI